MREREPGDLSADRGPGAGRGPPAAGRAQPVHGAPAGHARPDADLSCRRRAPDPHAARHPARPGRPRGRGGGSGSAALLRPQDPPQRGAGEPGHQPAAEPYHGEPSRPACARASRSTSWRCCARWRSGPRPAAAARRSSSTCARLTAPPLVEGDPITLREAFTNLLDNARHYAGDQYPGPDPGRRRRRRALVVDVADRGPGIADAEKERVLERFARGSAGTARRRQRAGPRHRQGRGRRARRQPGAARPAGRRAGRAAELPAARCRAGRRLRGSRGVAGRSGTHRRRRAPPTPSLYPAPQPETGAAADPCRDRPAADGAAPARFPGGASARSRSTMSICRPARSTTASWTPAGAARPRDQLGAWTCR